MIVMIICFTLLIYIRNDLYLIIFNLRDKTYKGFEYFISSYNLLNNQKMQ